MKKVTENKKKKFKIGFKFRRSNMWIGFYYQEHSQTLFFCPLPCLVFSFRWQRHYELKRCPGCGHPALMIAFNTGDGIALEWHCETCCEQVEEIAWPFGDREPSVEEIEAKGFNWW